MADLNYKITFSLGNKLDLVTAINKQVMPLLHQAVKAVAQQTAINWQKAVYGAKLWQGEKDKYAASINWSMTGDWSAVVETDYDLASQIETGRPARDLKAMLDTSMKVRRSKGGSRFLIIPFRHNTPGSGSSAMPTHIYDLAKSMAPSSVTGRNNRVSGQVSGNLKQRWEAVAASRNKRGAGTGPTKYLVNQSTYDWGGRLPAGLSQKVKPEHKTDIHAGMVRMDTSTPGGAKSSAYLTFRVMSDKSQGWIVPAQPGQYLAKQVADEMQPKATLAFKMAIQATLAKG